MYWTWRGWTHGVGCLDSRTARLNSLNSLFVCCKMGVILRCCNTRRRLRREDTHQAWNSPRFCISISLPVKRPFSTKIVEPTQPMLLRLDAAILLSKSLIQDQSIPIQCRNRHADMSVFVHGALQHFTGVAWCTDAYVDRFPGHEFSQKERGEERNHFNSKHSPYWVFSLSGQGGLWFCSNYDSGYTVLALEPTQGKTGSLIWLNKVWIVIAM